MEKGRGNGTNTLQTDNVFTRKEYIEREEALEKLLQCADVYDPECSDITVGHAMRKISAIPAADVVPVRRGYWIDKPSGAYGRWQSWCSVCGEHSGIGGIEKNRHKPYCPNCGARMDGDGE